MDTTAVVECCNKHQLKDAEYVVSSVVKQDGGREVNPDNNHVLTTGGQPPWPTSALNKTDWESTHRSLYNSGYEDVERSYNRDAFVSSIKCTT